ncbi:hypothetical protein SAMN06272765_5893 [Streptomyces sp. Ag109_G2-15]|nr:hypothetical protein SAMN06272765_5893 [Streptomyces sp. Ag109_G2-15]
MGGPGAGGRPRRASPGAAPGARDVHHGGHGVAPGARGGGRVVAAQRASRCGAGRHRERGADRRRPRRLSGRAPAGPGDAAVPGADGHVRRRRRASARGVRRARQAAVGRGASGDPAAGGPDELRARGTLVGDGGRHQRAGYRGRPGPAGAGVRGGALHTAGAAVDLCGRAGARSAHRPGPRRRGHHRWRRAGASAQSGLRAGGGAGRRVPARAAHLTPARRGLRPAECAGP